MTIGLAGSVFPSGCHRHPSKAALHKVIIIIIIIIFIIIIIVIVVVVFNIITFSPPSGDSETRVLAMPRWRVQVSTSASGAEFSAPGGEAGCSRLEGEDGEGDRPGGEEGPKRGRGRKQPNGKQGERKDWRLEFTWFPKLTTPCFPPIYNISHQPFGLLWVSIEVPTTPQQTKEKSSKAAS